MGLVRGPRALTTDALLVIEAEELKLKTLMD